MKFCEPFRIKPDNVITVDLNVNMNKECDCVEKQHDIDLSHEVDYLSKEKAMLRKYGSNQYIKKYLLNKKSLKKLKDTSVEELLYLSTGYQKYCDIFNTYTEMYQNVDISPKEKVDTYIRAINDTNMCLGTSTFLGAPTLAITTVAFLLSISTTNLGIEMGLTIGFILQLFLLAYLIVITVYVCHSLLQVDKKEKTVYTSSYMKHLDELFTGKERQK